MKRIKVAYYLNICIVLLEVLANLWMTSGIQIFAKTEVLSASKLAMLKYFTVDSNILMGVAALIYAICCRQVLSKKRDSIPLWVSSLQLLSVVSVTLTFMVTVFFLAPTAPYNWILLFADSNFLLHLLNPILAIITFVGFEKRDDLNFYHTFIGIVPMLIYAVFYIIATVTHAPGGVIEYGYDWYGFFIGGLKSGFIVVPIIIAITYLFSFVLWKLNRAFIKE